MRDARSSSLRLRSGSASLASLARPASISSVGAPGVAGAPGAPAVGGGGTGGTGGAGGSGDALASTPDATNQAAAIGGPGGAGGNRGPGARRSQRLAVRLWREWWDRRYGRSRERARDHGHHGRRRACGGGLRAAGAGGTGGGGGEGTGVPGAGSDGAGGNGGSALAESSASATTGNATALSVARGGAGANNGAPQPQSPFEEPFVHGSSPGGGGGAAVANATAVSVSGDASASAGAIGGNAAAGGGSASASSPEWPGGAPAEAHATAMSESGTATALAEARGGQAARTATLTGTGGPATPTAHAESVTGDASATARGIAGLGSPTWEGPLVSSPVLPGGPGASMQLVDAVSGSAGGRLTLVQEATATGGSARSVLHATNPAGGELAAEVSASGAGETNPGEAIVEAIGATDARVDARAHATGGTSASTVYCGIVACGLFYGVGGDGLAAASATGHGEVVSLAEARGANSPVLQAIGNAETVGPVPGAHATLGVSGDAESGAVYFPIFDVTRTVTATSGVGTAAPQLDPTAAAARAGQTSLFGAPSAGDVALWTSGNPASASALASGQALALGSLQAGGSPIALEYTGALELDLTRAAFSPSQHLGLAFLDPTSAGSLALLELRLTRDGETLFARSFDSDAAALAELDDAVFDLGPLFAPGTGELETWCSRSC